MSLAALKSDSPELSYHLDATLPTTLTLEKSDSGERQLMPWSPHFLWPLWHRNLTQVKGNLRAGPNISHDPCFREFWLRPEPTYTLKPTFPMSFREGIRQEGKGSPNGGDRLQVSDIFSLSLKQQEETNYMCQIFFPSLISFKILCCHDFTWFHLNLTCLKPWGNHTFFLWRCFS